MRQERSIHVLIVNVFFAPHSYGGATIVAEEVGHSLAARPGVQVSAISAMSRADLPPYAVTKCEVGGIQNFLINLPEGRSPVLHYANPDVAAKVAEIARGLAPDIAHVHCVQEIGADCLAALKGEGIPVILSLHDFWWLCSRQFMIRPDGQYCGQDPIRLSGCRTCVDDPGAAETRAGVLAQHASRADLITAPSEFARGLYARSGFLADRLCVWENGVHLPGPEFFEMQRDRRRDDPRLVFGYVGGPSTIKGWPLLRRVFSELGREDFAGVLVDGSLDGSWWSGQDLGALCGDWRVVPRYVQGTMDAFFAGIDVLLFLSQWKETFGLTIREALARGVRVIQTDGGGTVEHLGGKAVRTIPMGHQPGALRAAVLAELVAGQREVPPVPVHSFDDQAEAFLALARPLVGRGKKALAAA